MGKPTWCKPHSEPPGERHDGVMVHMQKCDLAVLFPEHKEDLEQTECITKDRGFKSMLTNPTFSDFDLLCPTSR